jgi:hypothetical protein
MVVRMLVTRIGRKKNRREEKEEFKDRRRSQERKNDTHVVSLSYTTF